MLEYPPSHDIMNSLPPLPNTPGGIGMKRNFSNYSPIHEYPPSAPPSALSIVPPPIGIDPSYIPQRRRRIASMSFEFSSFLLFSIILTCSAFYYIELSLLIKFGSCEVYRAIYLEHLTVKELTDKIVQRMEITKPVSSVLRKIISKDKKKAPMIVEVNDEVIQDMTEEQDITVGTEDNSDSTINLILKF